MRLDAALDFYLQHLHVERALSPNTVMAYGRDLGKLLAHAESVGVSEIEAVDLGVVAGWIREMSRAGLGPRSAARHLSSARGLCKFLMREGVLRADPTELAARPRFGRKLPRALGETEMLSLIETPEPTTLRGLRDRAMLSMMYAAGLRVSELVALTLGDVDRARGIVSALGKGKKRRLVPLGEVALDHLAAYLRAREAEAAELALDEVAPDRVRGLMQEDRTLAVDVGALVEGAQSCDSRSRPLADPAQGRGLFGKQLVVEDAGAAFQAQVTGRTK